MVCPAKPITVYSSGIADSDGTTAAQTLARVRLALPCGAMSEARVLAAARVLASEVRNLPLGDRRRVLERVHAVIEGLPCQELEDGSYWHQRPQMYSLLLATLPRVNQESSLRQLPNCVITNPRNPRHFDEPKGGNYRQVVR